MQILFEHVGGFLFLSFFSPYLEKSLIENPTDMIHGRGKKKSQQKTVFFLCITVLTPCCLTPSQVVQF